jgi:hypothetical protein
LASYKTRTRYGAWGNAHLHAGNDLCGRLVTYPPPFPPHTRTHTRRALTIIDGIMPSSLPFPYWC